MRCPRCPEQALVDHHLESWSIRVCLQCGGLFLEPEPFREAVRRPPPPGMDPTGPERLQPALWEESSLDCPVCRTAMRKGQYAYASGVVIDRCARCGGIWLDRGELAKIRAYVNRETPAEKVLLARAEAESLRRKFEAQERRDGARRGLSPDGAGGRPSALEGVVGFIWDLIWRTGR